MGMFMSFIDNDGIERPDGYLVIGLIVMYQTMSRIHLHWYNSKQDYEQGVLFLKQEGYELDNSTYTSSNIYGESYTYLLTLPEFSEAVLDS